jgi:hypothetical protein
MIFRLHRAIWGLIAGIAALAALVLLHFFTSGGEDNPVVVRDEVPSCAALSELIYAQQLVLHGQSEALALAGETEQADILRQTADSLGIDVCSQAAEGGG